MKEEPNFFFLLSYFSRKSKRGRERGSVWSLKKRGSGKRKREIGILEVAIRGFHCDFSLVFYCVIFLLSLSLFIHLVMVGLAYFINEKIFLCKRAE